MTNYYQSLAAADPEVFAAVQNETRRQHEGLELIASENIVSKAVLQAQGSVLTNKYAEGYPNKRYYQGCEFVDVTEQLAIDRLCKLFGCKFANVQPHSGANANMGVFMAVLQPGDTFLGMDLGHGGHLTHGCPVNFSGKWFNPVTYGINDQGVIDYDQVEKMALCALLFVEGVGRAGHAAGCAVWCVPYGYNEGAAVESLQCDRIVPDLDIATGWILGERSAVGGV